MEEVVVPEEPPKLVSALATYVQQERLCTMFLSIANKLLPLKPHACHLKRIRRSSATRVATAPMDGFAGGVICDKRDSSVATSTISDGCERNSAALGTPAAENSHILELLLSVGGPVDSSALKELESAADTTVAVHRVWVPDRAPRSSAEEWTKWCQIWPFATPKPRAPTQLSECEMGSIQRIFRTVVMPLAKRLRTDETLGIAAVLVDPSDGYRVLVSSGEEHALKRGNSAACLGYVSNSGCRKSNRVVLDHPVTFVLKEVTRKQCKDREVEGDASYLANGMDMFVSHEPCVMCSMALVHSRVRRVFYCFPNPVHGGLGSTVSIHAIQELNHHFRVFRCDSRWLSDPEGVSSDHDNPYWEDLTREIGHNGKLLRLGLPQIQMDPLLLGTSAGLERNCTVLFSHLTALCGTKPAGEPHNPLQVHLRVDDGHRDTALQHIKVLYDVAVRHNPRTSVTVVPLAPLEYYETPNRNTNSREGHKLPLFTASLMTPNCGFNPVYKGVAVGGTFDRLHGGHKLLLTTALLHATQVLRIGVTVSTMLTTKIHADLIEPFEVRCAAVTKFAHLLRPDLGLEVAGIADRAGGADSDPSLEALVVSPETVGALPSINTARLSVGLKPLECVLVPYVGVCDDEESRVSSTNIRKRLCELST